MEYIQGSLRFFCRTDTEFVKIRISLSLCLFLCFNLCSVRVAVYTESDTGCYAPCLFLNKEGGDVGEDVTVSKLAKSLSDSLIDPTTVKPWESGV